MPAEEFTPALFEALRGTACRISLAGGEPPLELEIAEVAKAGGSHGGRTQFSVVFLGPAGRYLRQRIYRLEHEKLGQVDLFLVPIGPEPSGRHRYEAVFT